MPSGEQPVRRDGACTVIVSPPAPVPSSCHAVSIDLGAYTFDAPNVRSIDAQGPRQLGELVRGGLATVERPPQNAHRGPSQRHATIHIYVIYFNEFRESFQVIPELFFARCEELDA